MWFEERYGEVYGDLFDRFRAIRPRPALRVRFPEVAGRLRERGVRLEPVPWYGRGFFFEGDVSRELARGEVYLQDAASMLPPVLLEPEGEVLDMAAAPGSKATQLLEMGARVVANEPDALRRRVLERNLVRYDGWEIAGMRGEELWKLGRRFNRVLLDAPCTNTGTMSRRAVEMFTPARLRRMVRLQKALIRAALRVLEPGGLLIYSTCSIDPQENDGVVRAAVRRGMVPEFPLEGLRRTEFGYQLLPHDFGTEGFYAARLRQPL